jgi:hypothetical protein
MYKAIKDIIFKEDLVNIFARISQSFLNIYLGSLSAVQIENKTGAQRYFKAFLTWKGRLKGETGYFLNSLRDIPIFPGVSLAQIEAVVQKISEQKCQLVLDSQKE